MTTFGNLCACCYAARIADGSACPECGHVPRLRTAQDVYCFFSKFAMPSEEEEITVDRRILGQEVTPMRDPGPKTPDGK